MKVLKLLVLGPVGSGKSIISNFLADATEIFDYHPTQGVRILEFEIKDVNFNNKSVKSDIELWDCSGDLKFKNCWPAFRRNAQGILFVHGPKSKENFEELEQFYEYFVNKSKLVPKNCLLLYYDPERKSEMPKNLSSNFSKISAINCNLEEEENKLKKDFQSFISTLLAKLQETTDQEEINMVNSILT
ncbi:intraflagellar transport protein 22 homolog [Leptopilina boulardi]|uniref:intraflagellar transport protein 22 homolog n=1 Tax=Leptopilina boulardi TaxID=63433 RepID=UPI0021F64E2A|nr:intraflagellar transport protein 22 homolog [Leptopilina boulardi]